MHEDAYTGAALVGLGLASFAIVGFSQSSATIAYSNPSAAMIGNESIRLDLFAGGSNSWVARTVGHAEGTRGVNGEKTRAYQGHTDPGNGVWNLGSFSFQHCPEAAYQCSTPEEADAHQLKRLARQYAAIQNIATSKGVRFNLDEALNAIDLANQAPLAALGAGGFVDRLVEARGKGVQGANAILFARVWSYFSDDKGGWDAPGLGNNKASITHDQNRRRAAIDAAKSAILRRQ
jgi:hypothetical protein